MTPYMDFAKRLLIVNAFFYSQCILLYSSINYCQLVWICDNGTNNNKINRLHEKCRCLIHNDKTLSFEDLLQKDGSVSIHHRNLRALVVELLKVFKGLTPVIFAKAFSVREQSQYNMSSYSYFAMSRVKSVNHRLESLS